LLANAPELTLRVKSTLPGAIGVESLDDLPHPAIPPKQMGAKNAAAPTPTCDKKSFLSIKSELIKNQYTKLYPQIGKWGS
jgi:hypothetical protein